MRLPKRVLKKRRSLPKFVRQESWRYVRLNTGYRRPRGKDSRMRLQKSGAPPLAKIGYGTPRSFRGLHPSGYREVLISSLSQLAALSPDKDALRLSGRLGGRMKTKLYEAAVEKGFKVLNPPLKKEESGE
ncbi:MAG: 50S ribosomal protein L32e [Candidatus Caldarchaeum sp.]|nr:50S ribosomal protein L32e [Candidatus Caldarchaeum sp.]MDW7977928.1 50S ribosomal protein L32e [Candidatus Caldarchaeum sp.]MDW8360436.1 50S ribosomal protein L32e [Candidatus Caldarchaeum sp.]